MLPASVAVSIPGMNRRDYYTVSRLTQGIKALLETGFDELWVRGEIVGLKLHSSGHHYFSLKDRDAKLSAMVFRSSAALLGLRPAEGMDVLCRGRLSVYPPNGSYSLVVDRMEEVGIGALLEELERRRQRLAEEGLFALERKKPLPLLPGCIGIVTSASSAAIRDMLKIIFDRYPARVIVFSAKVQGEGAAAELVAGLRKLDSMACVDVIIIGRGGGAVEDLLPFSDEALVRAVAACRKPVISAVGHEVDNPLCDLAADVRAATPTAAAELVVPVHEELLQWVSDRKRQIRRNLTSLDSFMGVHVSGLREQLALSLETALGRKRLVLGELASRMQGAHPRNRMELGGQRIEALRQTFGRELSHSTARAEASLRSLAGLLAQEGPGAQLARGYAIVRRQEDGRPVREAATLASGQEVELVFIDGSRAARIR